MEEKAGGWQAFPFSIQIFKLSNRAKIAHLNVGGLKICNNANLHHDLFFFFCHLFYIATILFKIIDKVTQRALFV